MAKAPRRRAGDDRGRRRPRGEEPPVARPVEPARPPAAKPIRPQAAKPVRPPAVPPVKPPAAQPVRPVAGKPTAAPALAARPAPPAAAPARRGAAGAGEEEVGARGRGRAAARGGYGGGMGLGAKVGLLAALVTLVVVGAVVLLASRPREPAPEEVLEAYGFQAASTIAAPGVSGYRGEGAAEAPAESGLGYYEGIFKALLGEKGATFWDGRVAELVQPVPRDQESSFAGEKLKADQARFRKELDRLTAKSGEGRVDNPARLGLTRAWNAMDKAPRAGVQVLAAWIREAAGQGEGTWLADTNVRRQALSYDATAYVDVGGGFAWVDGTYEGYAVRIFRARVRGDTPAEALNAYVAVTQQKPKDNMLALGLLMLVLGPLAVGFTSWAAAGRHAKDVRTLAREIDRLGSAGDPGRQIRGHGAEATMIARSIERMVANLDFRAKHEGADLDDIVSREQQIAQEIHGALMNKNPPRLSDYEVETLFKPGFEIGGDHFEYFPIDETHLGIILLDTNVRGIPAALAMAATKAYVRAAAPGVHSPAEVLKRVNRDLAGELPPGRHVTALYVVLDTAHGTATLASAGHLPLLVYRHQAGRMAKVNPEGIALGLDKGPVFDGSLQEGDIPIGLGDRIVLYTDGALRIQNGEGEEFGEQRFYAAVTNEAPKNSQAFVNFVGAAIDRFHLEVPQNDDITISTIKRLR